MGKGFPRQKDRPGPGLEEQKRFQNWNVHVAGAGRSEGRGERAQAEDQWGRSLMGWQAKLIPEAMAVGGRVTSLQDAHVLVPGTYGYGPSRGKRKVADAVKLRTFEVG